MRRLIILIAIQAALASGAIAAKNGGTTAVFGDAIDFSATASSMSANGTILGGSMSGASYGLLNFGGAGGTDLESGFYSRLVELSSLDYISPSTGSYSLVWASGYTNPAGTTYAAVVSTLSAAEPYLDYYTTDSFGYPVQGLTPNASFYNFVYADYMSSDFSQIYSTIAVTYAVDPSSGIFSLKTVGHNSLNISFSGNKNPPASLSGWTNSGVLPASLYGQASVLSGERIYLSGGYDGVRFSSAVYSSAVSRSGDLTGWFLAGYMPAARYGHQLIAAHGRLYLLGGYDNSGPRSEVWSAAISSTGVLSVWEAETALPAPLYFHSAALAGNTIYIAGGYTSGAISLGLYKINLGLDGTLGAWINTGDLPAPRYGHSLSASPGLLSLIGGNDGSSARGEVWTHALDLSGGLSGSWNENPALPAPRFGHKTIVSANRLFVFGGSNGSAAQAQVYQTTISANGSTGFWQVAMVLPAPRQFHCAEVIADKLYSFGGSDGSAASSAVYISTLSGTEYLIELAADSGFTTGISSFGWTVSQEINFGGLTPSAQLFSRAKARNRLGIETNWLIGPSTTTFAAVPGTAPWTGVGVLAARANWSPGENAGGTNYELVYSSYPDFSFPLTRNVSVLFADLVGLEGNASYYAKVRAFDTLGRPSHYTLLGSTRTLFDYSLDKTSPTITDNQPDFTAVKSTNTFLCAVVFNDTGGAGLSEFKIKSATDTGGLTGITAPWTTVVSGINQNVYLQGWRIPQSVWEAMPEGTSNYVSLQVYDNSGNKEELTDVFFVLKDTTVPSLVSTYAPADIWHTEYPGDPSGLKFTDSVSGLSRLQYSVTTNKGAGDGTVTDWTDISGLTAGATTYTASFSYDFNRLANGTSNYFSLRALDVAGSTATFTDVFGIGKNVIGPIVIITTPSASYLSAFNAVAGITTQFADRPVLGTEVSIAEAGSGLYFNGTGFLSASRVWVDAQDAGNNFTISLPGLPLTDGMQYQVVARSSDSHGDYSAVFSTYTFTFDTSAPAVSVLTPENGSVYSGSLVSGTAADSLSGLYTVDGALRRLSDGKWWDNSLSVWQASSQAIAAGASRDWTWSWSEYLRDSLTNNTSYYISMRARDKAIPPNIGEFMSFGSTFTYLDAAPPSATSGLKAETGEVSGSMFLSWLTAGDNGATGYLLSGSYKIAYSTAAGTTVSTATAQISISTGNLTAGSTQSLLIMSLEPSVNYYFSLWTADDALNWSPISNQASGLSGAPNTGSLTGKVTDAANQPLTGVLVQAVNAKGEIEGSDYTDSLGQYSLAGLNSSMLELRLTWITSDIESSVAKDNITNGSSGVNFTLSATYQLAEISGVIPSGFMPKNVHTQKAKAYTTKAFKTLANQPFAEIYARGARIGAAFTDSAGRFEVKNLLPGTYSVRVFNGTDYSKLETVRLLPGVKAEFIPQWTLINKSKVYAYPNPAVSRINFHFDSAAAVFEAQVNVFDITGRLVKTLKTTAADAVAGGYKIVWDFSGEHIASGAYIYSLSVKTASGTAPETVIKKMAIIR